MNDLADTTELLAPKRLLVRGAVMLDRYTYGRTERLSRRPRWWRSKRRDGKSDWAMPGQWPDSW